MEGEMKHRVAKTIKWNAIDKLASQVLYAVTGIILAILLSKADFGLVAAVMVFQAFASLFVDSGFSFALIQRKNPTELDYSTVFWFNLAMAVGIYVVLFFCAPLIAWCFENDQRLIPLSRVMFLSFILNATAIVQTNRLMKRMDVKMVAVSNSAGLIAGAVVGISLAFTGFGAWAIVWQTITVAFVKSAVLWGTGDWRPLMRFSMTALGSFFKVGMGVMGSSFLNTLFQNIYSFFIGNRNGFVSLGYYTQSEKWSKMGIASLSQILTASFLPALSQYQDSPREFAAATAKMNRFTAYLMFPAIGMLGLMATPIFHALFGTKWDPSIILFQLLLFRGIFTVYVSLYNNYILALGHSKILVYTELLRDVVALVAILVTLPYIGWSEPGAVTKGLEIFIWGQIVASGVTWLATLLITARLSWRSWWEYITDFLPYAAVTCVSMAVMLQWIWVIENPWMLLCVQGLTGMALYIGINWLAGSKMQADAMDYLFRKRRG